MGEHSAEGVALYSRGGRLSNLFGAEHESILLAQRAQQQQSASSMSSLRPHPRPRRRVDGDSELVSRL